LPVFCQRSGAIHPVPLGLTDDRQAGRQSTVEIHCGFNECTALLQQYGGLSAIQYK